ncbi:MAG: diaminopimelate epimerase [Alphaproteobacteria bacterium]|nr:diaminopimelate epimerase [Alphaproteobacteria bacterium]
MELNFVKMNGIGNDFIVLDARARAIELSSRQAAYLADRHFGIGCDQILIIAPSDVADIKMIILNSDASVAAACGNGSRCVADLVMTETGADQLTIETLGGVISARRWGDRIAIDMGMARVDWAEIPLAHAADTMAIPLGDDDLPPAIGVNMGNPHAVHIVDDAEAVDLARIGPRLETHPIFPDRANIEFISLMAKDTIRMRVWERGSGITIACGTGACASAVAAARAGLTGRKVAVHLDGGVLEINWRDDGGVTMTGPSSLVFTGAITLPDDAELAS